MWRDIFLSCCDLRLLVTNIVPLDLETILFKFCFFVRMIIYFGGNAEQE